MLRLEEILDSVSKERIVEMRQRLSEVWQYFYYPPYEGSKAIAAILRILATRVPRLQALSSKQP